MSILLFIYHQGPCFQCSLFKSYHLTTHGCSDCHILLALVSKMLLWFLTYNSEGINIYVIILTVAFTSIGIPTLKTSIIFFPTRDIITDFNCYVRSCTTKQSSPWDGYLFQHNCQHLYFSPGYSIILIKLNLYLWL